MKMIKGYLVQMEKATLVDEASEFSWSKIMRIVEDVHSWSKEAQVHLGQIDIEMSKELSKEANGVSD